MLTSLFTESLGTLPGARGRGAREDFSALYPKEDRERRKPEHELKVAAEVGRFEDEGWRVRKDGSLFWANVVISAVRNAEGMLVGFAKVTRDLSERRRTEERLRISEAKYRQITVESELGKGSVFRVVLPAARLEAVEKPAPAAASPAKGELRGRVLVVDDDAKVGGALRRALVKEHEVVLTTDGGQAAGPVSRRTTQASIEGPAAP